MNRVVFLDRDGVINVEKNYLYKIEDFEFIDGVFDTLKHLQSLGFRLVIVTNQSGIGRGYYTKEDFDKLTSWMVKRFEDEKIDIDGVYCCPHAPTDECNCRKPLTGMIEDAKKLYEIDFENSWLIGDKSSDIKLAHNVNIQNTIQVKSGHQFDEKSSIAKYVLESIKEVPSIIKS